MDIVHREVTYYSEGDRIAADLFLPADASAEHPVPGVVLCTGFGGTRKDHIPNFAKRFAEAGFASLCFDFRGFGDSEGPEGKLVGREHVVDARNSVTYLETVPEIDPERIAIWGTSYGASHAVIAAAQDDRIKVVVSQVGFADGSRGVRGSTHPRALKFLQQIAEDRKHRVLTGKPNLKPASFFMRDAESAAQREARGGPERMISQEAQEAVYDSRPVRWVADIAPRPLLVLATEVDPLTPAKESQKLYDAAGEPRKIVVYPGARHYDIYSGPVYEQAVNEAIDWFKKYL
jgi:fermentation-respiration switch protein FrsA (DUF1100 family)